MGCGCRRARRRGVDPWSESYRDQRVLIRTLRSSWREHLAGTAKLDAYARPRARGIEAAVEWARGRVLGGEGARERVRIAARRRCHEASELVAAHAIGAGDMQDPGFVRLHQLEQG